MDTLVETASGVGQADKGTAYGHVRGTHDAALTEVGGGTPMGELLRRYWMPVGLAADATALPRMVRVLGEDLVLFRNGRGEAGLLYPRCVHRGSSLFYGSVEEDGLRCCYHGWKFDPQGNCLDQPCEPQGGRRANVFRQPWYPVQERYGLIFAYLGPPDRKPLLPRYSALEEMADGERLFADDNNIGAGTRVGEPLVPFNWFQHYENIQDNAHFIWLHNFHSGAQFGQRFGELEARNFAVWDWVARNTYRETDRGVLTERIDPLPDGGNIAVRVETVLPCVRVVPSPWGVQGPVDQLGFMLPVDNTHFRIFTVLRAADDSYFQRFYKSNAARFAEIDRNPSLTQTNPNDLEAQGSQGPITLHSEERLVPSDEGVVKLRRLFKRQIDRVAAGHDPIGTAFIAGEEFVRLEAGAFVLAD